MLAYQKELQRVSGSSLFPGVDVVVVRSARRTRTISINVKPGIVTVRAPRAISDKEVATVLKERRQWIADALASTETQRRHAEQWASQPLRLFGIPLSLRFQSVLEGKWQVRRIEDELHVSGPAASVEDPLVQQAVRSWYRQTAKEYMGQRLSELARKLGYTYQQVRIKEQKTRWGSCSAKGNINLNWRLMQTPKPVIDYVLVHELCHLREMNHSVRFWRLVEAACPDFQTARQWLKHNAKNLPL